MTLAHDNPMEDSTQQRDGVVRGLCASLFAEPHRLRATLTHRIEQRFIIAPHRHEGLLQFDLLVGCGGRAKMGDEWTDLQGVTAMVAGPGVEHGYRLEPIAGREPGRVYHFRMEVDPATPCEVFPGLLTDLAPNEPLAAAMRVVVRLGTVESARPPMLLARLAEVLCLWPGGVHAVDDTPEEQDRGLAAAVELIDHRLEDPPSLEELAEVAHFSVRHFARRFQAAFGCTPHTYLTARRFAQARQLLSQERMQVGRIATQLGFGSVATFSRWFSQQAGMSPTDYRKNPEIM